MRSASSAGLRKGAVEGIGNQGDTTYVCINTMHVYDEMLGKLEASVPKQANEYETQAV